MRVMLDTNVIIDVLQRREPWFEAGSKIFLAAAAKQITGCITAKQSADIHFFSRKQFKGMDNVDEKARQVVLKLFSLFEVIDTLAVDCQDAFGIENNDFEDAILIASAYRAGVDIIITRNLEHFQKSPVKVCSPTELVELLGV